jgi:hypothetical protein
MPPAWTIDHHRPIGFAEAEIPAGPSFEVTVAPDAKSVTVSGVCPACGGRTVTVIPSGYGYGHKGPRRSGRPVAVPGEVTVFCECGHVHPDRPPDALDAGCGRFWVVELPR